MYRVAKAMRDSFMKGSTASPPASFLLFQLSPVGNASTPPQPPMLQRSGRFSRVEEGPRPLLGNSREEEALRAATVARRRRRRRDSFRLCH